MGNIMDRKLPEPVCFSGTKGLVLQKPMNHKSEACNNYNQNCLWWQTILKIHRKSNIPNQLFTKFIYMDKETKEGTL